MQKEVMMIFSFVVLIAFVGLAINQIIYSQDDVTGDLKGISKQIRKARDQARLGMPETPKLRCPMNKIIINGKCAPIPKPCKDDDAELGYGNSFIKGSLTGKLAVPGNIVNLIEDHCVSSGRVVGACYTNQDPSCSVREYFCKPQPVMEDPNYGFRDVKCAYNCLGGACLTFQR